MSNPSPPTLEPPPRRTPPRPETYDLWSCYHSQHDPATENSLIEQYLPLVKTVVGRLAMTLPSHVNLEDLHSAGLMGLLQAVRKYDPHCGTAFETYARVRIRGAVLDELRHMDWVPRLIHEKARRVRNAMSELEQATGQVPTEGQVAQALHLSTDEYLRWLEEIRPATFVCLDAAIHTESHNCQTQYESIADDTQENPEQCASRRELAGLIVERMQHLPEMQSKVLALYYFEDLRLREIAAVFGLTESRICQIHSQAILSMRAYLEAYETTAA